MRGRLYPFFYSILLLAVIQGPVDGQPNYAFAACKSSSQIFRVDMDDPAHPVTLFADESDGLHDPWAMAFHPDPPDGYDHLYVGGEEGNITKIRIDSNGDKVDATLFSSCPGVKSLAFQPGTHRLYAGSFYYIYRYSEDGSYETVVASGAFYDESHIAFHPETGDLYVATGFYNEIMVFSSEGEHLRNLESYVGMPAWFLPIAPLFVHDMFLGGGSEWQLLVAAIKKPASYFTIMRFDPLNDVLLGEELEGQLCCVWNLNRCWATGDYYIGVMDYPQMSKIPSDFSSVTIIDDPQFPAYQALSVVAWPPPPLDTDGDGLSDDWETSLGLNCNNGDTDGDGVKDCAEVGYDGNYEDYNPSVTDTDANAADTDGGGENDGAEIGKGRDPLDAGDDDSDDDGLPNELEDVVGTDRDDPDSDDDGITDYEEVAWNGSAGEYTPYPTPTPDTNPLHADTDGDGYSDLVEMAGGSDPLVYGWTADVFQIRVSFQPALASRPAAYATDTGWSYSAERGYGWE